MATLFLVNLLATVLSPFYESDQGRDNPQIQVFLTYVFSFWLQNNGSGRKSVYQLHFFTPGRLRNFGRHQRTKVRDEPKRSHLGNDQEIDGEQTNLLYTLLFWLVLLCLFAYLRAWTAAFILLYLKTPNRIIHTTRLIYHLSIYLLQFYWSHPSHKPPHNVTAKLTIQGNRMKSTIATLNGSTQTSHLVC